MTAKQMAYGNIGGGTNSSTYRLERGFPFVRRGVVVAPIPQFKGLTLYSQSPTNAPHTFQQTVTNANSNSTATRVRWPVSPGKQVTSST